MSTASEEQNIPQTELIIRIFRALVLVVISAALGYLVFSNATNPESDKPFKLGLDLAGGSHLVYEADVSSIAPLEVPELMGVLRTVIERRVNLLGTEENVVYVEESSFVTDTPAYRLVVELPGVTDVEEAVREIGNTPLLEFKLLDETVLSSQQSIVANFTPDEDGQIDPEELMAALESVGEAYIDTGLTGRYLESAVLEFAGGQGGQLANEPVVSIRFSPEGATLFAQITRDNVGERLAIFLDGEIISSPRINEVIVGGTAIISGGFNPTEARELAQNLSFGALPMPIELVSTQTIGATLGAEVLDRGMTAGMIGFAFVALFMIAYYRVPGLIAVIALLSYIVLMLAIFQYLPVTLTAAGLAGFVLSLGIAVDANVLVFERLKEELRGKANSHSAIRSAFTRAWSAIRDGNFTSILAAVILFWFGTAMVKGFALVFGLGVVVSMFSALVITRTLLLALPDFPKDQVASRRFWFGERSS
ncbi:MAG: protein translocase subunit SecD [Candidatus Paceibacteria bacterium]